MHGTPPWGRFKATSTSCFGDNEYDCTPTEYKRLHSSAVRQRIELMSLTKWRTEYYLIKRTSISLLRVKTSSLVAFLFSDWIKKTNRLLQSASVCVDRYRQIFVEFFFFFQNTSVWRTEILVELISIMLLKTHSKSDSHPNQKTWYSLHL